MAKTYLKELGSRLAEADVFNKASQVAFFFAFSVLPLLIFITSLFGLIVDSSDALREELFVYLGQVMPDSAYSLVRSTLDEIISASSGRKVTVGLLLALWFASSGVDDLRIALNHVYRTEETRPWIRTRILAAFLTLIMGILLSAAMVLVFQGQRVVNWLIPSAPSALLGILSYIGIVIALLLVFSIIYSFLPNRKPKRWTPVTRGAIVAIGLWLLCSLGFQLYLTIFNSYAVTYGSLGAVIILLLWLYLSAVVVLIGAAIDELHIERQSRN
jgi:membrane protein